METLADLLDSLKVLLPENRRALMLPGADIGDLRDTHNLKYGATEELKLLFSWCGGVEEEFEDVTPFGFRLIPLHESAEYTLGIQRLCRKHSRGVRHYWELLAVGTNGSDTIFATLDNESGVSSRFYRVFADDGSGFLLHEGLEAVVRTALECWRIKDVPVDYEEVAKRFSPRFGEPCSYLED